MSQNESAANSNEAANVDMSTWNVASHDWWYRIIGSVSINITYHPKHGWGVDQVKNSALLHDTAYFGEAFADAVKAAESTAETIVMPQSSAESTVGRNDTVVIPVAVLDQIINMARSHADDIKDGIDDHTYSREENLALPVKLNAIEVAEKLIQQSKLKFVR